ncbi:hypothetical protein [Wenjunlia vitaminophila]|uniref:hypothetical protein n=1 Tax=Wenjunlia vitaminophila TaxID=76728 RepID=UPI00039CC592|nr:hypothetical protein [Wenjunlia vitaminophila]
MSTVPTTPPSPPSPPSPPPPGGEPGDGDREEQPTTEELRQRADALLREIHRHLGRGAR